jgi:hypothetical protein
MFDMGFAPCASDCALRSNGITDLHETKGSASPWLEKGGQESEAISPFL